MKDLRVRYGLEYWTDVGSSAVHIDRLTFADTDTDNVEALHCSLSG